MNEMEENIKSFSRKKNVRKGQEFGEVIKGAPTEFNEGEKQDYMGET